MLVGLCGAIGSGKTTAAKHLVNHCDFERVSFAAALKQMAHVLFTEEQINGSLKETPDPRYRGITPREFMQKLGTQFGRDLIYPDLWVDVWKARAQTIMNGSGRLNVVADDVRFPNEVAAVKGLGGVVIRVERTNHTPPASLHASEVQQLDHDFVIVNDGDFHDFRRKIDDLLFVTG